jgi:DDE_Tnp_1-associated
VSEIEIIKAFADIKDPRRRAGQRHNLPLCLALFTLAIAAGNKGFLAIGDWISSYHEQLIELFKEERKIGYLLTALCAVPYYTLITSSIPCALPSSLTYNQLVEKPLA